MLKSKDLTTLVILAGIVGVASMLFSNLVFSNKKTLTTKVEVVDPVSSEFSYENKTYFSPNALNPTKDITIKQNDNQDPLGN
ncbi:hypothetical protein KC930_02605 [Candidatus Saccharibacteria bacterium]|nr:hypothetical protein [Candidatus Saccharibacteria bacterium]